MSLFKSFLLVTLGWVMFPVMSWAQIPGENFTCNSDLLHGRWQYYKYYYKGQYQPPANPRLILEFQFDPDGTSHLRWERTNENGFCYRKGQFVFEDCLLTDEVTWVDPENNVECSRDPDMRVGNVSKTRAEFREGDLYLYLSLGDEDFVYIWKPVSTDSGDDGAQNDDWRFPGFVDEQ